MVEMHVGIRGVIKITCTWIVGAYARRLFDRIWYGAKIHLQRKKSGYVLCIVNLINQTVAVEKPRLDPFLRYA